MELGTQRGSALGDDEGRVSLRLPVDRQEPRSGLYTVVSLRPVGTGVRARVWLKRKRGGAWGKTGLCPALGGGLPHRAG